MLAIQQDEVRDMLLSGLNLHPLRSSAMVARHDASHRGKLVWTTNVGGTAVGMPYWVLRKLGLRFQQAGVCRGPTLGYLTGVAGLGRLVSQRGLPNLVLS